MYWWAMKRVHVTWQILASCLGFIFGVAVAPYVVGMGAWAVIAGAIITLCSLARSRRLLLPMAFIAGLLFGAWHGTNAYERLAPLKGAIGQRAVLSGTVIEDTSVSKGKLVVKLHKLLSNSKTLDGTLWITTGLNTNIKRSDQLTVDGVLSDGFASYTVSMYDARITRHERVEYADPALAIRDGFAALVKKSVDEPMASLGLGFLVGQKNDLPADLTENLRLAGLTHIVVASGYNLTVIIRLARRFFEKHSKYLATMIPLTLMLGFIAIAGASPSMSRAGIVTALGLGAWYLGRNFHPVSLLAYAAVLSLIVQPSFAWGDIGWLLSFAAFGGVMLLAPIVHAYFFGIEKASFVRQTLVETISAQIATAPILIVMFGQLSVVAILSNLLVLPLIPLAMLLTLLAGMTTWLVPGFAGLAGWPVDLLVGYMVKVINWTAQLPWAIVEINMPWLYTVAAYGILGAVLFYGRWASGYRLHNASIVK